MNSTQSQWKSKQGLLQNLQDDFKIYVEMQRSLIAKEKFLNERVGELILSDFKNTIQWL